jgi:hypothetical protein
MTATPNRAPSRLRRASRWLLHTTPPPAPILPLTTFARSQRAALRSR